MREREELRMTQRFGLSSEKDGVATYREGENRRGGGRTDFGRKIENQF